MVIGSSVPVWQLIARSVCMCRCVGVWPFSWWLQVLVCRYSNWWLAVCVCVGAWVCEAIWPMLAGTGVLV